MRLDPITSSGLGLDGTSSTSPITRYVPTLCALRVEPLQRHRLPGEHSGVEPPDPIPNSAVKRTRANGSVAQAMRE